MNKNLKTKTIALGTLIGALVGAVSSYLLIKRSEAQGETPKLTAGEGVQVGLGVLGLLRLIAGFGED